MPLDIIQEKMPLPSIGENAVDGILYHRHFLLTPLFLVAIQAIQASGACAPQVPQNLLIVICFWKNVLQHLCVHDAVKSQVSKSNQ